ncbi:MAG TPA: Clp protease N-terminal domain-containing protein [Rhabdochlamydiaceae bacterium]
MDPQLTEPVAAALQKAIQNAESQHHTEVSEFHLLKALFEDPQGCFSTFAASVQLSREELLKTF